MCLIKVPFFAILIVLARTSTQSTIIVQDPANDTFCEGTDAKLRCVIFDNTTASVADNTGWINANTLGPVAGEMINNTRDGDVVTSLLTIENVLLSDNGARYFCVPKFGTMSFVGMILVVDEPNAVNNTQIKNITCDSFNVTWDNVNDIFNYIIRWYGQNGDNGVNMTTGLSYTVTGLAAKTSYNVTVVASNNFCGEGQVSDVTMIMTDNECPSPTIISTASISNVTINMTPTITATTLTTSPPTPSATGADTEGGSSNGAIIGGVVGGIAGAIIVIIIIIFMVYCCIYRNRDSTDSDKQGLKSPTGTGGSHTASVQPSSQSSVPHQTADSGAEYAVTTKVNTTTKTSHQPTEDYAMVDKNKKHAAATQGITYADLQALPSSGDKPIGNQGPTATYARVA